MNAIVINKGVNLGKASVVGVLYTKYQLRTSTHNPCEDKRLIVLRTVVGYMEWM